MRSALTSPFVCAALTICALAVKAQTLVPVAPMRLIVPYAAGGLPDAVARILSPTLQLCLGQPVVVENKNGGSSAVSAIAIAQAPADGQTLLVTDGQLLAVSSLLSIEPAYDARRDFVPVSLVGTAPLFLAVNPKVKAHNLDELIGLAKSRPGALNYGSAGVGSPHHLTAEAIKESLGLFITHVPFRGSGASVPALVGNQVDMVFASPPALMGFVRTGQARLIAINAAKRSPLAPDVPALSERIPGFDFAFTVAVMARTGTPQAAIARIDRAIAAAVGQAEIAEALRAIGVDPVRGSPDELGKALQAGRTRVAAAAGRAKLKA